MDYTQTINRYLAEQAEESSKLHAAEEQASRYMDHLDPLFDEFVEYLYDGVYQEEDPDGRYTVWPSYETFIDQYGEENG